MKKGTWIILSALGCFLLIFGSTIGTYIFSILWPPLSYELESDRILQFLLIFQITSYIVLGGSIIIVIGLISVWLNHNKIGSIVMIFGLVIALIGILFYFFGAIEAATSYTVTDGRVIVLLPLLTINLTFELIGLILNFLSRARFKKEHIYQ